MERERLSARHLSRSLVVVTRSSGVSSGPLTAPKLPGTVLGPAQPHSSEWKGVWLLKGHAWPARALA